MFGTHFFEHCMQGFGMPPSGTYHESQSTTPWQSSQPAFGPAGGRVQTVYNPAIGTPIPPVREYNNQTPYQAQHRESGIDRNVADRLLREIHKAAQGAQFNSQAGYSHGGSTTVNNMSRVRDMRALNLDQGPPWCLSHPMRNRPRAEALIHRTKPDVKGHSTSKP